MDDIKERLTWESVTCVCQLLLIEVIKNKSGKSDTLVRLIYRYLNSDKVTNLQDEGLSTLIILNNLLKIWSAEVLWTTLCQMHW